MDRILPTMDKELGTTLKKVLEKQGLSFQLSASAKSAAIEGEEARVTIEGGGKSSTESFDMVLVAIGRRPYTAGLGLDSVGVALDKKGGVEVEERDGLVKVIADAKTDRVLGIHILGPRASDLIAEAALAIEFGSSAEDIARTCHAHPTLPEAVKEAALGVAGRSIHI